MTEKSEIKNQKSEIILCPGQGAQGVGMGKSWVDKNPMAAQVFAQADVALGFELSKLCFEGPAEELNRTDNAQVALYVAGVACYRALAEDGKIENVAAAAGLSLGEFTALHVAGAFDFEDGLKLVRLRGQAMQDAAEANPSTMVAITGDVTEEKITELCDRAREDQILVPANFNSPMQVVISGSIEACERAVPIASEMGFKPTPLTVAGAFHSPLMAAAAERLAGALDEVNWSVPTVPVMSNVTALLHENDIASIKQRLVDQLTNPVRWSQCMQWLTANATGNYIELAPNKVLSGLMRRIDRSVKVANMSEAS